MEADGRSPSIPSMRPAISRRAKGPRSTRTGGRRPAPMTARFSRSGCSRVSRSGWYVSTSAIRSSRAIRATNVAKARVAASATWRSSRASTTGRSAARRPSQRSSASSARGCRRSGSASALEREPAMPSASRASAGSSRRMGPASRRSRATISAGGRVAITGSSAASTDAHGGSAGPYARPRRTRGGIGVAEARVSVSSMKRVTPIPALPETITVVAAPPAAVAIASATRASSASRPTKRRLTTLPGIDAL